MKPEISPLRCVQAFVADISVKANPSFDPHKEMDLSYEKLNIDSTVFEPPQEDSPSQVTLTVSQDAAASENIPYSFNIEMVGFFEAKGVKKEELKRFIYIQGSSVLYGMARGALNDTMAKGPFVAISLPLVSFYKGAAQANEVKAPTKKSAKQATKKATKSSPAKGSK